MNGNVYNAGIQALDCAVDWHSIDHCTGTSNLQ